ncbi:hypothetical protein P170DRAFT_380715 [Aspergillus steynii IBT 23096]|uniref:NYN domain-containing protein n=1 Tax=Aspergillus steynii IBT 23096 TaxID=1392250 RepID=A0A2I2GBK5_9EURO|nr:uncharacterized protein P170DRAFT_380715 [Aspergillus steynii IBT 23096]PLB50227.1 hypothetical protein P170DRAFT_380715 [Aspergillus steynii IBT 23096]
MPSSSTSSSNWDFTPVINLLRSPTYSDGYQSSLSRHHESRRSPSTSGSSTPKNTVTHLGLQPTDGAHHGDTSPKLGDFSTLWNALGPYTTTPVKAEVAASGEPPAPKVAAGQQSQRPPRIEILKRPTQEKDVGSVNDELPRTPPKPIPGSGATKAGKSTVRSSKTKQPPQIVNPIESSSPGSSAEADSDVSIFDPCFSGRKGALSLVPPQVGAPPTINPCETPPSSYDERDEDLTPKGVKNVPSCGSIRVQPLAYKSSPERRVGLLTKLINSFPEYAETVAQLGRSANSSRTTQASRPIHVFIDMSNIMVGFHDSVKVSRNIPVTTRIRRVPLSFQNFSLILERGRPASKRVLVGSDRFAAIDEGEKLGYEANILDRVQKVKQPTRRQLRFRKNPRGAQDGSGSETNDVPPGRWVEQAVDEILHLKILESLLDTDEPATIVLATGDAAEAEFSGGFMRMVERALQRGWNVELVSFSQVTSYAYRKKEFRAKWGDRFKLIALDGYIEELMAC